MLLLPDDLGSAACDTAVKIISLHAASACCDIRLCAVESLLARVACTTSLPDMQVSSEVQMCRRYAMHAWLSHMC